jgi:thiol-disulfide isomerase/thioredoxin
MRAVLLITCFLLMGAAAMPKPLPPGTLSPDDLGKTLDGQAIHASALRGRVVVISFWATWCEYCMQELPILGGLQATATERHLPLQVVEINFKEDHRTFSRATHLLMPKLPGLLLTWDRDGRLAKAFGVGDVLPAMVLLHRDGTIADIEIGYDKSALDPLVAEINKLVNEPAPPPAVAATSATANR